MSKRIDLTGQKFGKLTVIKFNSQTHKWVCECECGNITEKSSVVLRKSAGKTSCGCYFHGGFGTKLYGVWSAMKRRCHNQNSNYYSEYGGRGITVCEQWLEYPQFEKWALQNGYQDGKTLDRKDTNGNYTPDNCRFVDWKTQQNNRRNNIIIQHDGNDYNINQLCTKYNLNYTTIHERYRKGERNFNKLIGGNR